MIIFKKDQQGAVLIELSLVILVIIFIGLAAFEVTSVMKYKQFALQLSRELANSVFKDCPDVNEGLQVQCLNQRAQEVYNFSQAVIPNSYVYVTIWYRRPGEGSNRSSFWQPSTPPISTITCNAPESRYKDGGVKSSNVTALLDPIAGLTSVVDMVVVAEAYVPYNPTFTALANTLGLQGCFFYDATII